MSYNCHAPEHYIHTKVGSGSSVDYVKTASIAPSTGTWRQGVKVQSAGTGIIAKGTVIATMEHEHFNSHNGHAAVYLSHDTHGIRVLDQWIGQPVHERVIPFTAMGPTRDEGTNFYVVE